MASASNCVPGVPSQSALLEQEVLEAVAPASHQGCQVLLQVQSQVLQQRATSERKVNRLSAAPSVLQPSCIFVNANQRQTSVSKSSHEFVLWSVEHNEFVAKQVEVRTTSHGHKVGS